MTSLSSTILSPYLFIKTRKCIIILCHTNSSLDLSGCIYSQWDYYGSVTSIPNSVTMHCAASWGKWAAWRPKKTRESKQLVQTTARQSLPFLRTKPSVSLSFPRRVVCNSVDCVSALHSRPTPVFKHDSNWVRCIQYQSNPFLPASVSHPPQHSRFLSSWSTMAPMVFVSM